MNMHPPISASSPVPLSWEQVISTFEPQFPQFADIARDQQAAGEAADDFIDQLSKAFRISDRALGLERVFSLSRERDLNLSQEEIELALDRIEGGGAEAAIISEIELARTRSAASAEQEAVARDRWEAARTSYLQAKQAYETCDERADEQAGSPLFNAYCDSLAQLEATTAPDNAALVFTMRASLNFGAFAGQFEHADDFECVEALRTSGDAHGTVLAQTWLHVLRLAGEHSPALGVSAEDFDADAWVRAYQDAGGLAYKTHMEWQGAPTQPGLMLSYPHDRNLRSRALERELLSAEKHSAVFDAAPSLNEAADMMSARAAVQATGRDVDVITLPQAALRRAKRDAIRYAAE